MTRAAFVRSLTISGFGLLGGFLPVLSYAVLALVAGIGSTIVAEARDFRAADIHDVMQMIVRSEQERQSADIKQRGELADFNGIHAVDGDDSGAGLFEGLAFITKLSRVEDHDPVSSGSPFRSSHGQVPSLVS